MDQQQEEASEQEKRRRTEESFPNLAARFLRFSSSTGSTGLGAAAGTAGAGALVLALAEEAEGGTAAVRCRGGVGVALSACPDQVSGSLFKIEKESHVPRARKRRERGRL